ncbi:acyltransferase family protein [Lachnoclostridium sp. Marseille-P6806]|uniref:acyltransferase family protein n=1 Tax=Lachnoclostridium sp. Marseille-P6806 TaxID=2364793 RepID=UPI001032760F|nr:acyltransferase family protein [Lachnoclostridium sp. Marseille-P6806]
MLLWAVSAVSMLQFVTAVSEFSTSFNSVAWFLSSLFVIYMFSPFLLRLLKRMLSTKRRIMAALFALPVAASGSGWLFHRIEMRTFFDELSYVSPYWRVFYVVFGMVLALLAAEDRGFRMGAVAFSEEKHRSARGTVHVCIPDPLSDRSVSDVVSGNGGALRGAVCGRIDSRRYVCSIVWIVESEEMKAGISWPVQDQHFRLKEYVYTSISRHPNTSSAFKNFEIIIEMACIRHFMVILFFP